MNQPSPVMTFGLPSIASGYRQRDPEIPANVSLAMAFVQHCNEYTAPRAYIYYDDGVPIETEVRRLKLHPGQEGTFRLALDCLNDYFYVDRPKRRRKPK